MAFAFDVVPVTALLRMAVDDSLFLQQSGVSISGILLLLGGLVLGIACVDFANLAAARAAQRAREVGLRKTLGATAWRVLRQHLLEAGLLTAAALALALSLIGAAAPALARATGIDLRQGLFAVAESWPVLAGLLVAVTLAAGAYPALILARLPAAAVLRAGQARGGPGRLAAVLAGVQFAVAAFLLIAVVVVHWQNQRLERTGLRLAVAPLLVIENRADVTGLAQATLRDELLRLPQVISATQLETPPWTVPAGTMPLKNSPDETAVARTALLQIIGPDFFATFDVPLVAGRVFDPARADDVARVGSGPPTATEHVILSRTLARELGFASPEAAVGELIHLPGRAQRVIGVVEDKAINISTGFGARPGVYLFNPERPFHVVRIEPRDVADALTEIDALWERLVPGVPPSRRFADEYFNDAYTSFVRVNQAFTGLALAALLIATTGLFAVALLAAARRVHEIGVRKTLGATTTEMVLMLLAAFAKPVVIANVIAWPLAYVALRAYLNVFIDPIALTPAPFVVALAVTLLVAIVAVGGQAIAAARTAPARVLRRE